MSAFAAGKASWPEVVGLEVEAAVHKINNDRPDVAIVVIPAGSVVTDDFDTNRVRVFVNKDHTVAKTPVVG